MRKPTIALLSTAALLPAVLITNPAAAAAPASPAAIARVTASPGPRVGEVTLRWSSSGRNTTGFRLVTALDTFDRSNSGGPSNGRYSHVTSFSRNQRSVVLSAHQVAVLGAGVASGNALFFRFYAVNTTGGGTAAHAYPYQRAVLPKPAAPKARGTALRVATFNVRTAAATDAHTWSRRADLVAREIVSHQPGVVALQELGPGRADGGKGPTTGHPRQTTSLLSALARNGGGRYRLVRTTPYVAPGVLSSTQGGRILYDSSRYALLSRCPETTGRRAYSSACSIFLPVLPGAGARDMRRGGVAQLRDRRTGKRFWVVSVHLDSRGHTGSMALQRKYDALREVQANYVAWRMARVNTTHDPVIIGGDFNSWQNSRVGNSPHDRLIALGYYDTSAALTRINFQYSTMNDFRTRIPLSTHGVGVRLDQIFVKGAWGARRYENVMKVVNTNRPSDHNLVLSDIVL